MEEQQMNAKKFMLIVNLTTIVSLGLFLALGWLKLSDIILVGIISLLLVNIVGAVALRLRTR